MDKSWRPVSAFDLLVMEGVTTSNAIRKTLLMDKVETKEDGLIDIYRRLRPGNPPTPDVAQEFVDQLFFKTPIMIFQASGV